MSGFGQLGVQPWLSKQCAYMAVHSPTPIQRACIPAILAGKHVVGGAATGSGKTAAFALPLLQLLSEDLYGVFALVLTPSRELAYQILDQFLALGAPLRIRTMLAIGGVGHEEQVDALKARPHVVVATPGRLLHLLETFAAEVRRAFTHLRFLVMDEADRLTEGDMEADVRSVLGLLAPTPRRRTLLFSATLHPRLTELVESHAGSILPLVGITQATDLHVVSLANATVPGEPEAGTALVTSGNGGDATSTSVGESPGGFMLPATLKQRYVFIPDMVKLPNLVAALRSRGKDQRTIVFVNSCMRAELVRLTLQLLGFPVCSLDSLLTQQSRLDNLALFKLGVARILVATDIAARGLDIPEVGLVLHYDVPKHAATYVHRVGRTARAGRAGLSVALVTEYDVALVQRIEKKTDVKMSLWAEKGLRESSVLRVLDEVSAAKIQAKQQVSEQFGNRVLSLKEHAAEKRAKRAEEEQAARTNHELPVHTRTQRRLRPTDRLVTPSSRKDDEVQEAGRARRDTATARLRVAKRSRSSTGDSDKPLTSVIQKR